MEKREVVSQPMYDGSGSEVTGDGIPYREIFNQDEYLRLAFQVFRFDPNRSDVLATDAAKPTGETIMVDLYRPKSAWEKYIDVQRAKYGLNR